MFGQHHAENVLARMRNKLIIEEAEREPVKIQVQEMPRLSTIEDAQRKARTLVAAMEARKRHWEDVIQNATEELRQANIVLDGGKQMLAIIEQGMRLPEAHPIVHDEIDTTVSVAEPDSAFMDELLKNLGPITSR